MSEELVRLGNLDARLKQVEVTLGELRDAFLKSHFCPAPGTCLRLDVTQGDHEKRIRALEKANWLIAGGCVVVNLTVVVVLKFV